MGWPFFTVAREGLELALFLLAGSFTAGPLPTYLGALFGLGVAALLGWALFRGSLRWNLRQFFTVTNVILILFAAGLVAHGVHEFNEAALIPALIEHVWDINAWLPEKSTLGLLLTALFGYNGNPSLTEVMAYLFYFMAIILGLRSVGRKRAVKPARAG